MRSVEAVTLDAAVRIQWLDCCALSVCRKSGLADCYGRNIDNRDAGGLSGWFIKLHAYIVFLNINAECYGQ
eukprot:6467692-Amphidinium_carterae.1